LESRGLFLPWSQVQALWLLIWWSMEVYMVVNFRTREISQGARTQTDPNTHVNNNNKKQRTLYIIFTSRKNSMRAHVFLFCMYFAEKCWICRGLVYSDKFSRNILGVFKSIYMITFVFWCFLKIYFTWKKYQFFFYFNFFMILIG